MGGARLRCANTCDTLSDRLLVLLLCCVMAGDLFGPKPPEVGSSPCTWRVLVPPGPLTIDAVRRDWPWILQTWLQIQSPVLTRCVTWTSGLASMSLIAFPLCKMGTITLPTCGYCEDLMRLPQREADSWADMALPGSSWRWDSGQTQGLSVPRILICNTVIVTVSGGKDVVETPPATVC